MSAVIAKTGEVRALDGKAGPPVNVTTEDVQDPATLARMLQDARRELAELRRLWRFRPRFYKDLAVDGTGTTVYQVAHNFGGGVFWWPVKWSPSVAGTEVRISEHADTDESTLRFVSGAAGTVTICVVGEG